MSSTRAALLRGFSAPFGWTGWRALGLVTIGLFAFACASPPPPRAPVEMRQAAHDKDKETPEEPPILHVAPPPAYGHKVVSLDTPHGPQPL